MVWSESVILYESVNLNLDLGLSDSLKSYKLVSN
jgi:hypothetical protein